MKLDKNKYKLILEEIDRVQRRSLDSNERTPLKGSKETQRNMKKFIEMFSAIQEEMEPLKKRSRELTEVFKSRNLLSADQIRLAKRVHTLLKSDLPIQDLPKAVEMFLEDPSSIETIAEGEIDED